MADPPKSPNPQLNSSDTTPTGAALVTAPESEDKRLPVQLTNTPTGADLVSAPENEDKRNCVQLTYVIDCASLLVLGAHLSVGMPSQSTVNNILQAVLSQNSKVRKEHLCWVTK